MHPIKDFESLIQRVDYSLLNNLSADPEATEDGEDHRPRQVRSGHYVPVKPTPIPSSEYVAHSHALFDELGLDQDLAQDESFRRLFSGDISVAQEPMRPFGWATGYALSIYGTEYTQQCPFQNGNGYGDGRAISVFEGVFKSGRWEMQLKGGGPTPYCRGADGRAVLRSSVREFLAQEYMHALGIPTSRSLTLYTSRSETIYRPWYSEGSRTFNPDIYTENPVAITTRVASSFLRVGQLELFARRARSDAHPAALDELRAITQHLIEREYRAEVDASLDLSDQVVKLAECYRSRLISLVTHWMRVGYCQGNFNSDNCAAGGFTLDYGPFGFCERFNPRFQPWTGGGEHFSFFNQPAAAEVNFKMFWTALQPLLKGHVDAQARLDELRESFAEAMGRALKRMWARKLGLATLDTALLTELLRLMTRSEVDYTIFFRELSSIPEELTPLKRSFYAPSSEELDAQWRAWLTQWRDQVTSSGDLEEISSLMKRVNPSVAWREWLVAPAYQQAERGDYSLVRELQEVLSHPYDELTQQQADQYDRLRPQELLRAGGISHYSCSS